MSCAKATACAKAIACADHRANAHATARAEPMVSADAVACAVREAGIGLNLAERASKWVETGPTSGQIRPNPDRP